MLERFCILLLFLPLPLAAAEPVSVKELAASLEKQVGREYPSLDALYKDLHAHAELGFQEIRTASKLAKQLAAAGFTVTEKVGGTGVVGVLKNGAGPVLLVRADMDGLPI